MKTKFEKLFASRNPHYEFLLSRLQCAIGKDHVDFEDINTINLRKFKDYMDGEVSANSLKTYFACMAAFIRECANDGLIPNDKCLSALKVKATPQQNVALTEDEVQRIYEYYERLCTRERHQAEKDVLTLFLIECYCGARGCDVEEFTVNNIQNGMLSYVSKKTKTLATMPAHKNLLKLIRRIPKRKRYERTVKNRIIKRVCERVGIIEPVTIMYRGKFQTKPKYEYIAAHSARRSFASVLATKGAPLIDISQYMGHQSINMTMRYIKTDTKNVSSAAMEFFNG